jgi:lipid-binding SYLF domain-containing protein
MKTLLRIVLCAVMLTSITFASEAASSRLETSATVLNEIMATPDKGIPSDILGSAKCVAVVPNLLKGGFIVGGAHGRGMATCRTATGWSAPAPITTTGGSVGLQIGGQSVDLVMVVMNDRGMQALLTNKFKLGADASVAAGPVGRHTEGATDWKLRAEVLTYSRARGLFAGISFNGAVIKQDEDATGELYGRQVDFKTILTGSVQPPQTAEKFLAAVKQAAGTDVAPSSTAVSSTAPSSRPPAPVNPPAATPTPTAAPTPATETAPATETTPSPTPTPTPPAAANRVEAKFDPAVLS